MTVLLWIGWLVLFFCACKATLWAAVFSIFASGEYFVRWKDAAIPIVVAIVLWWLTFHFAPFTVSASVSVS